MARKLPRPVLKEDFDKILSYLKKELKNQWKPRAKKYTKRGERILDYMIAMIFAYGAGMRISEICGLKKVQKYKRKNKEGEIIEKTIISEIPPVSPETIEGNHIRIIAGKGRKDGVVPLPTKLFIKAGITRKMLFQRLPIKVSYRATQNYVSKLGTNVLKKHISFHQFRHGFVTYILESGMNIHQIQMFARHSRLDTTGLYLHANPKKALAKYEEIEW